MRRYALARRCTVAGIIALLCIGAAPHDAALRDGNEGGDWPAYGNTYGEQHFSQLKAINAGNVASLGLAWSMDLDVANSVTQPLAVDGVLYVVTGYSIIRAIDAVTGKLLWTYDPKVSEVAGRKLRTGWGVRGIAYWNGSIYTATQEGRLIAVDAKTGAPRWQVMTVNPEELTYVTGAPRAFDGKVIIGNAGADVGAVRGYVTAYDAGTGKQLWRFHTVPGDPAKGFESAAMAMAAKTWAGKWWEMGGGGTVWNAITYDAELDTIYLGTGNGAPWNRKVRSADTGDNLFLASIVALDARTGAYKWHYQVNPGETWDYNAAMDMALATLSIDGKPRQVLIQAPKNGFLYVIDRVTGKLISAKPYVPVTWATGIDLTTGRPIEDPASRYPDGKPFILRPGSFGSHNWLPMAFSPQAGLAYIPTTYLASRFSDAGITPETWKRYPGGANDGAVSTSIVDEPAARNSALTAWNPVTQTLAWQVVTPGPTNGGTMASAGNLVFQGQLDGLFSAYAADTGMRLWSFAAGAPVLAPPITYIAHGRQYVTVQTGLGTGSGALGAFMQPYTVDSRTQARRVLTFAIGGKAKLPGAVMANVVPVDDPDFVPTATPALMRTGAEAFGRRCAHCHGLGAVAAGSAPDLRASPFILSPEGFASVVHDGALVPGGMPKFDELDDDMLGHIRQYLRGEAKKAVSGS